jgi:hypothetical protein
MAWNQVANIRGPTGSTGLTGPQGPSGAPGVGFTWRGVWSGSTAYAINDAVSRTNQSYVCAIANTGNDPATDTTHWNLMAAQGGTGAAGPAGLNAFNTTSAAFTVPASGSTVTVTLGDASWVVIGQMVVVAGAGGAGVAGTMFVTAKTGNQITLQTP